MDAVLTCMVNDALSSGQIADLFVKEISAYVGTAGGIAFREYARAVDTAVDALEMEPGSSVILSPFSPREYVASLQRRGCRTLFADVNEQSGCLDPDRIEELLQEKPQGIIIHAPFGILPDIDRISSFGVPLIEDLSSGLGAHTGERKFGSYGRIVIVGLEPEGLITAGGGAIIMGSGKREVGVLKGLAEGLPRSTFMTDLNAALGLTQLRGIEQYIQRRREIGAVYTAALAKSRYRTLVQGGDAENVFHSFPVVFTMGTKDAVMYARKRGVETAEGFTDTALTVSDDARKCRNAVSLASRSILFPLYPMLGKKNVETIAKILSSLP
jgi:dTDP-4-amino-4,6-dideoxygalactose transaminase